MGVTESRTRLSDFHYICTELCVLHELHRLVLVAILWGRLHYLAFFFGGGGILLGMQDLSSLTREVWSPNHWTARKFLS